MHILQPKHTKLSKEEAEKILTQLNVSRTQIPKILATDPAIPEGCERGDIIKLERKEEDSVVIYFRVVV